MPIIRKINQRRLRRIHSPHGPGSSRVIITEAGTALRDTLYKGFDEKTQSANRTNFAHFLNEHYNIPMQTAYGKLYEWRIEEWEVYGLTGIINKYCKENGINKPLWPTISEGEECHDEWRMTLADWHSTLRDKMKFYNYLCERGMCRTKYGRILSGASAVTHLQLVGLGTAFNQWAQKQIEAHIKDV